MFNPNAIQVGRPFPGVLVSGPITEPSAGWHVPGNVIVHVDHGLTPQRAAEFWSEAQLWSLRVGHLVVLQARLKDGTCLDMPTGPIESQSTLPGWASEYAVGERLAFTIACVDANTGLVSFVKTATASPHFSKQTVKYIRETWARPMSVIEFLSATQCLCLRYPSAAALRRAATAHTRLGA